MKSSNSPTMKDVAAEAGVALGTVSKVFNNIPVGEQYRIRVEEAAKKLGYQVNHYARGMRTNKTNTIAVIMPELNHPFFSRLSEEMIRYLASRNYNSILAVTDRDPDIERQCIYMVRQQKADGIIALTYNHNEEDIGDIPFVSIDRSFDGKTPCITSDNFAGGRLAAKKLVELGSRKLLFLRTGSDVPGEPDKRGAGFENYCKDNQIPYDCLRATNTPQEISIYPKMKEWIEQGTFDYDGIFCSTDHLAYHTAAFLRKQGIRIPEDVQIIGFDGLKTFWDDAYPVSTIAQPVEQLARTAVDTLLSISTSQHASLICLPVTYIVGRTTRDYQDGE